MGFKLCRFLATVFLRFVRRCFRDAILHRMYLGLNRTALSFLFSLSVVYIIRDFYAALDVLGTTCLSSS
jgi:hypothetical protein